MPTHVVSAGRLVGSRQGFTASVPAQYLRVCREDGTKKRTCVQEDRDDDASRRHRWRASALHEALPAKEEKKNDWYDRRLIVTQNRADQRERDRGKGCCRECEPRGSVCREYAERLVGELEQSRGRQQRQRERRSRTRTAVRAVA